MKKIGDSIYVHRSNERELINAIEDVNDKIKVLYHIVNHEGVNHAILKYSKTKRTISFIFCDTFDTLNEPIVGNSIICDIDTGREKFKKAREINPQIYHHKWMFVDEDYIGFDVSEAKKRSEQWLSIPGIDEHKHLIGNRDYWIDLLHKNGLEV